MLTVTFLVKAGLIVFLPTPGKCFRSVDKMNRSVLFAFARRFIRRRPINVRIPTNVLFTSERIFLCSMVAFRCNAIGLPETDFDFCRRNLCWMKADRLLAAAEPRELRLRSGRLSTCSRRIIRWLKSIYFWFFRTEKRRMWFRSISAVPDIAALVVRRRLDAGTSGSATTSPLRLPEPPAAMGGRPAQLLPPWRGRGRQARAGGSRSVRRGTCGTGNVCNEHRIAEPRPRASVAGTSGLPNK
jgi:hypothetical protein